MLAHARATRRATNPSLSYLLRDRLGGFVPKQAILQTYRNSSHKDRAHHSQQKTEPLQLT